MKPEVKNVAPELVVQQSTSPEIKKGAVEPEFTAKSIYAVDLNSGKVLFSKNPNTPILPASTTKMASALVALDYYQTEDVITIGKVNIDGQKIGLLEGEKISVHDLLNGLLVASGNDTAEVLAANYPGGRQQFIDKMNELAETLGLENTHFVNPTGLDEYLHFSTAKDLVKIASFAIQNPVIAQIVATPETSTLGLNMKAHKLFNVNLLVGKIPGVIGVKTGWTINSGESVVTLINRDNKRVMMALMGSADRFGETEKLINWTFENYSWPGVGLTP
ncbi:MAG: D-alanyl-D-alanine carboxypeptidase family protein [bacterium]|nr:D-alanyl-D-alanine carboxypeptidase family protein [bacterium]